VPACLSRVDSDLGDVRGPESRSAIQDPVEDLDGEDRERQQDERERDLHVDEHGARCQAPGGAAAL
jgi:hypothetical protein